MLQKKMFKVITAIEKPTGTYWMRVGSAFTNKDNSVNIYLDVIPKSFQVQLRELDEEDLRRREGFRAGGEARQPATAQAFGAPGGDRATSNGTPEQIPF